MRTVSLQLNKDSPFQTLVVLSGLWVSTLQHSSGFNNLSPWLTKFRNALCFVTVYVRKLQAITTIRPNKSPLFKPE